METAAGLRELFQHGLGRTRGLLRQEIQEHFGATSGQWVVQGLAKLLEDRCEFEVHSGRPPEEVRQAVFSAAAAARCGRDPQPQGAQRGGGPGDGERHVARCAEHGGPGAGQDRQAILSQAARDLGLSGADVERALFADLKSEQRLVKFRDVPPERLLEGYNVSLAQSVLLRSTRLEVWIRGEPPRRYRQLLRAAKFHGLMCDAEPSGPQGCRLRLDGPLSLFRATHKYGLRVGLFLPTLLLCRDFELQAQLLWGPARRPKCFTLGPADGLVSHARDTGMHVPPEMQMFATLFRRQVADWELAEATEIHRLGDTFWVPDYCLIHRRTGQKIWLDVLGFWRRSGAESHLARLRTHVREPFIVAVSERLRVEGPEEDGETDGLLRFREMPLPDEVARLANHLLSPR